MRLFVAIELPAELRRRIAAVVPPLPHARFVPEAQLHLTLQFLGELPPEREADVRAALDRVRVPPFSLTTAGAGRFPPRGPPRVLWIGFRESPALAALADEVEVALVAADLPARDKPFSPHLTVARIERASPPELATALAAYSALPATTFAVDRFVLFESQLSPRGATHTPRHVVRL